MCPSPEPPRHVKHVQMSFPKPPGHVKHVQMSRSAGGIWIPQIPLTSSHLKYDRWSFLEPKSFMHSSNPSTSSYPTCASDPTHPDPETPQFSPASSHMLTQSPTTLPRTTHTIPRELGGNGGSPSIILMIWAEVMGRGGRTDSIPLGRWGHCRLYVRFA